MENEQSRLENSGLKILAGGGGKILAHFPSPASPAFFGDALPSLERDDCERNIPQRKEKNSCCKNCTDSVGGGEKGSGVYLPLKQVGEHRRVAEGLKSRTVGQAVELYVDNRTKSGKWCPGRADHVKRYLRYCTDIIGADLPADQLSYNHCESLAVKVGGNGSWCAYTREAIRQSFVAFVRWLIKHSVISTDCSVVWEREEINPECHKRVYHDFSVEEFEKLASFLPPNVSRLWWFAFLTGQRKSNCTKAVWIFDTTLPYITPDWIFVVPAASFKQRREFRLPLYAIPRVVDILGTQGKLGSEVFPGLSSNSSLHRSLKAAARKSGIPESWAYAHNLRRSFCANLARAGVSREMAMKLLDWRSEVTLLNHYWPKVSVSEKAEILSALKGVKNG